MADIPVRVIINAIDNASSELKKFGGSIEGIESKLKTVGVAASALGGITTLVTKSFIQQAGAFEQNTVAFEVMLGNAQKAKGLLGDIREFAKRTPFSFEELVEGSKRLLAYNTSAEELLPTLDALGNISAGVGREKLPDLIRAFGQVQAKGKLMAQELNQFAEAGVPLREMLARDLKMSLEEFSTQLDKGNLNIKFDQVKESLFALTEEGGRFNDLMQKQSTTTLGKISNLSDGIQQMQVAMGQALLPAANDVLNALTPLILKFTEWAEKNPELVRVLVATGLAIGALGVVIVGLGVLIPPLIAGFGLLVAAIGFLISPVGLLVIGVTALTAGIVFLIEKFDLWQETMGGAQSMLMTIISQMQPFIGMVLTLTMQFDLLNISEKRVTDAQRELKIATDQLADAQNVLKGASLNLEGAQLRVERATKTAAETTRRYGKDSLEAREASHNLKLAQDDLKNAQDRVKESGDKVTEAQKKVKEATENAGKAAENAKGKVVSLADVFGDLAGKIGNAISKLGEFASKNIGGLVSGGGRQMGGPVSAASSYTVGEQGPEGFTPQTAGYITPHGAYAGGSGSGGNTTIQFIINSEMIINSPSERRSIAEALYKDLVVLAKSRGMTVQELMGA